MFLALSLAAINEKANHEKVYSLPISERMAFFAKEFIDTPYVGKTLDQEPSLEKCTVLLNGLDCVTFMETTLALARTKSPTLNSLNSAVAKTRYWSGKVNGFLSRLHYTSDWIFDNAQKGTVTDLSKQLPGAELFTKKVGFMTSHYQSYPALKLNPKLLPRLAKQEAESNLREKWFIPINKIKAIEPRLKSGDIVAICGGVEGIECTHVGLIIKEKGVPHFVHASSKKMLVTFDKSISEYLEGSKTATGIMVCRPVENLK
jgi:hypothetical protein